jgi:hypothetical protein
MHLKESGEFALAVGHVNVLSVAPLVCEGADHFAEHQ